MHVIVERLAALVAKNGWGQAFESALNDVAEQNVTALTRVKTLDDYLHYIDDMVHWAPRECGDSLLVHDKLVEFYFVLDQPALRSLQSPTLPGTSDQPLTPLSEWIVDFAKAWGSYLDLPDSARHIDSFRSNPEFRWDDYMPAPSGYFTFNQFFARHAKPGRRPVANLNDPSVVVSPADATFNGQWLIASDSTIAGETKELSVKGLRWSITELLKDSQYAHRFASGLFTHVGLRTFDYHRFHSPVAGKVLEARVIEGRAYLDVTTEESKDGSGGRTLTAVEGMGYQFMQTRGLMVLDSPIGLVACLPVGMAQVASVVLTAEVGVELHKGEELGYFQFGGSDFIMVFEDQSQVHIVAAKGQHFLQGEAFASAVTISDG